MYLLIYEWEFVINVKKSENDCNYYPTIVKLSSLTFELDATKTASDVHLLRRYLVRSDKTLINLLVLSLIGED